MRPQQGQVQPLWSRVEGAGHPSRSPRAPFLHEVERPQGHARQVQLPQNPPQDVSLADGGRSWPRTPNHHCQHTTTDRNFLFTHTMTTAQLRGTRAVFASGLVSGVGWKPWPPHREHPHTDSDTPQHFVCQRPTLRLPHTSQPRAERPVWGCSCRLEFKV